MNYNKLGGSSNKKYAHSITLKLTAGFVSLGTIINDISHKMSINEITTFLVANGFTTINNPFLANGYLTSNDKYVLGISAGATSVNIITPSITLSLIINSSGGGYQGYSSYSIQEIIDYVVEI